MGLTQRSIIAMTILFSLFLPGAYAQEFSLVGMWTFNNHYEFINHQVAGTGRERGFRHIEFDGNGIASVQFQNSAIQKAVYTVRDNRIPPLVVPGARKFWIWINQVNQKEMMYSYFHGGTLDSAADVFLTIGTMR